MQSYLKSFTKIYAFITVLLIFSLLFNSGTLFYEWGFYSDFLRSMLKDGDFNIINQVIPEARWLVTKTLFHPAVHPESQTALLFPLYLPEFLLTTMIQKPMEYLFEYLLTSYLMNAFCIITSFILLKKIAAVIKVSLSKWDGLIFYLGCPIFYFSILQVTVVEIASLPLVTYLILAYLQMKRGEFPSAWLVGICAIFLLITKITYTPLVILVYFYLFIQAWSGRNWKFLMVTVAWISVIFACDAINRCVKYGEYLSVVMPAGSFVDLSIENIWTNFLGFFFAKESLLVANPIWIFAILGFAFLLKKLWKEKLVNRIEIVFIILWFCYIFFNHIVIIGYVVEDHLPGRIHLAYAPFLILGLAYARSRLKAWKPYLSEGVLAFCCLWHLLVTFFYLLITQLNTYTYSDNMIPNRTIFLDGFASYLGVLKKNFEMIQIHSLYILFYGALISILGIIFIRQKKKIRILEGFAVICGLSFVFMTYLNFKNHQKNIDVLKTQNFYADKAIGAGKEIFYIDYWLDLAKTIKTRNNNPRVNEKLKVVIDDYYTKVEKQVVKATPELAKAIKDRSPDFSFEIRRQSKKASE